MWGSPSLPPDIELKYIILECKETLKRSGKVENLYRHVFASKSYHRLLTFCQLLVNIMSTLCQHNVNSKSTVRQHYVNIMSTLCQHNVNIVSFGRRPTAIGRNFFIKYFNFVL